MKANRFAKNDEGVSAVIGVILMVAITVILAAVIAAFVFGMVGGVKKTYIVGCTIQRTVAGDGSDNSGTVLVTYNGGQDSTSLKALSVTATTSTTAPTTLSYTTVGSISTIKDKGYPDTVTVTATWMDGSSSVISQQTV